MAEALWAFLLAIAAFALFLLAYRSQKARRAGKKSTLAPRRRVLMHCLRHPQRRCRPTRQTRQTTGCGVSALRMFWLSMSRQPVWRQTIASSVSVLSCLAPPDWPSAGSTCVSTIFCSTPGSRAIQKPDACTVTGTNTLAGQEKFGRCAASYPRDESCRPDRCAQCRV